MLDLVALTRSQLLLFPAGELLSELPPLPSGLCHAHNAEDERDEGGREYVEILWAASSSKTKKDGLRKKNVYNFISGFLCCFHAALHTFFSSLCSLSSVKTTPMFFGACSLHTYHSTQLFESVHSAVMTRGFGLSLNPFLSIFQSLGQCVIVQLTHLLDKSQIHSTKGKTKNTEPFFSPFH